MKPRAQSREPRAKSLEPRAGNTCLENVVPWGREAPVTELSALSSQLSAGRPAFSLLEVVVAVGIFAVGMLAVVGLFTPVAKSVVSTTDAAVAAQVADALRTKLQTMPAADVIALLKNANGASHELTAEDARPDYNPTTDSKVLFANRDGSKIGGYTDPVWGTRTATFNPDREKYFEIALVRNETLTPRTLPPVGETTEPTEPPADPDASAFLIAFTARLRWPMFIPDGVSGAIQVGSNTSNTVRFDHGQKQVMFFTGSVTR